jgi:hemerythrin-like domain-containing protein
MAEAAKAYESGEQAAGAQWADAALDYVALLRAHIAKENNILFVMAERILSAADQQRLATAFDGVDENGMGEGEGERLLRLADNLAAGIAATSKR